MTALTLGLILFTVTLSACAQLTFKLGVTRPDMAAAMQAGALEAAIAAALNPFIWAGVTIYGLSVALWLYVLSKVDLSIAYPFVGVSFLVTMAFGALFLSEHITFGRAAGTILIAVGCVLVARSA